MNNKKSQKLDKFAKIYDKSKEEIDVQLNESERRYKEIKESFEKKFGPTIFYDGIEDLMEEYEALTNRNRIRALEFLTINDRVSLTEISEELGTSVPTARKHLEILETAGMVGSKIKTTEKGKTRIFFSKRKLVKRRKAEETLRQKMLKIDNQKSFIFNSVKNCTLKIAKSNAFRGYIKAAKLDDDWKISDALEETIKEALNRYITTPTSLDLIDNDEDYGIESNFEILAAVNRFDLIDEKVENICELYATDAIYDNKTKEIVLNKIDHFLERVEKLKDEMSQKLGGENAS